MIVDFTVVLPELIVAIAAMVIILADLYLPRSQRRWLAYLSLMGLAAAFIDVLVQHADHKTGFYGSVALDGFSLFSCAVLLFAGRYIG